MGMKTFFRVTQKKAKREQKSSNFCGEIGLGASEKLRAE
jgi:hypothetical protein